MTFSALASALSTDPRSPVDERTTVAFRCLDEANQRLPSRLAAQRTRGALKCGLASRVGGAVRTGSEVPRSAAAGTTSKTETSDPGATEGRTSLIGARFPRISCVDEQTSCTGIRGGSAREGTYWTWLVGRGRQGRTVGKLEGQLDGHGKRQLARAARGRQVCETGSDPVPQAFERIVFRRTGRSGTRHGSAREWGAPRLITIGRRQRRTRCRQTKVSLC